MLVSVASDIALVLDDDGVIRSVALGGSEPMRTTASEWLGRQMRDTASDDTRDKVAELLAEAGQGGVSRTRHINHPSAQGADVPVAYTAVRLGTQGPTLVVGRDLRAVAAMQQRLVDAQQAMERDYWRMRQAETRYRLLFQIATDAVVVIDAESLRIVDANRAAGRLFGAVVSDMHGRPAGIGLTDASRRSLEALLGAVRMSERPAEMICELAHGGGPVHVRIALFRDEGSTLLLMRAGQERQWPAVDEDMLPELVRLTPDAVAFTHDDGRVIDANPAFSALIQVGDVAALRNRPLSDWLLGVDGGLDGLLRSLSKSGALRVQARIRPQFGQDVPVELTAVLIHHGDTHAVGFIIRTASRGGGERQDVAQVH